MHTILTLKTGLRAEAQFCTKKMDESLSAASKIETLNFDKKIDVVRIV